MVERRASYCRFCHCACPIWVEVQDGAPAGVTGVRDNPVFHGFTCPKGRALHEQHTDPGRLLHSRKRMEDGRYAPIGVEQAMDEIAERLRELVDRHGPRTVATYAGTYGLVSPATGALSQSWMHAIGSPLSFDALTIDCPGKVVAKGLHGYWRAGAQNFDRPDVIVLVGLNPLVSNAAGLPHTNGPRWLKEQQQRGCKLVVVDPRRTETARRADLHLQLRPGEDIALLAALIQVLIREDLIDREFLDAEVQGFEALREAVALFAPEVVSDRVGVSSEDLIRAARLWGQAPRGYLTVGTGPNMRGAGATLVEYLGLCLQTLCGRWLRAGEVVHQPGTLAPKHRYVAQPLPRKPAFDFGTRLRSRDVGQSIAGLPTAMLPDEMLLDGGDRVRALISVCGNPAVAWPDQSKVIAALEAADLFVQIDIRMSASAKLADYVIAPKMSLEVPGMTLLQDMLTLSSIGYGFAEPWAQYTEAVVDPPEGADLIEEWEFFYGLAQRMGLQLHLGSAAAPIALDMDRKPTTSELFDYIARGSRIPLDEVRAAPLGDVFRGEPVVVEARHAKCEDYLDVGHADMMADLAAEAERTDHDDVADAFPFRLIVRRLASAYNSSGHQLERLHRGRTYNPAFLHPEDLAALGVEAGDVVEISGVHASILGVVEPDAALRRGLVSMSHSWGDVPELDGEVRRIGSNTGRLVDNEAGWDRYSGIPAMSNIPVSVRPCSREA